MGNSLSIGSNPLKVSIGSKWDAAAVPSRISSYPASLLDQLAMHQRDLPSQPSKAQETDLGPYVDRLAKCWVRWRNEWRDIIHQGHRFAPEPGEL